VAVADLIVRADRNSVEQVCSCLSIPRSFHDHSTIIPLRSSARRIVEDLRDLGIIVSTLSNTNHLVRHVIAADSMQGSIFAASFVVCAETTVVTPNACTSPASSRARIQSFPCSPLN
jgi:hypothetical protein